MQLVYTRERKHIGTKWLRVTCLALLLAATQSLRSRALEDSQSHLIVGLVPIFREVRGKSIGGDLNVDDKGSEQRRFELVQSLHHGSVGYQPMCT
jgi:hypothetical protein